MSYAMPRSEAASCALQPFQALPGADEDDPAPDPRKLEELERDRVVGRAEEPDGERARHHGGRDQTRRRELIVGAEPEREHDERDQHEGRTMRPAPGRRSREE